MLDVTSSPGLSWRGKGQKLVGSWGPKTTLFDHTRGVWAKLGNRAASPQEEKSEIRDPIVITKVASVSPSTVPHSDKVSKNASLPDNGTVISQDKCNAPPKANQSAVPVFDQPSTVTNPAAPPQVSPTHAVPSQASIETF